MIVTKELVLEGPLVRAFLGFRLLFEAWGFLFAQRSLWGLAAVPLAFSLVAVAGAVALVVAQAGWLHDFVTQWLPFLEAGAWYTWIWIGPAKLLLALAGYLLFAVAAGIVVVAASLLANVVAAPFLDVLSQRVERIEAGEAWESGESGLAGLWNEGRRSVFNEARRLAFFVSVWVIVSALGLLVPGGQILAPPVLVFFTLLLLPLEYSGYSLDRLQVPFRERRAWVRENLPLMLGFGAAAFLICLVPGLNFLLLPSLVVAGTLLARRHPPR